MCLHKGGETNEENGAFLPFFFLSSSKSHVLESEGFDAHICENLSGTKLEDCHIMMKESQKVPVVHFREASKIQESI